MYLQVFVFKITEKNTVISSDFLVWKFCGKSQFPHGFGRIARNYAETVFPQNFHTRKSGEVTVFFPVDKASFEDVILIISVINRAWWKSRTQSRDVRTPGTPTNIRDPLELPDVMREKHFSGIIISFVYLRGYSF